MEFKGVLLLAIVALASAELPDWDKFSARFPSYTGLPMTEREAVKDGWRLIKDACKEKAQFVGRQYTKDASDKSRMLLFDASGKTAGFQMAFSNNLGVAKNWVGKVVLNDGSHYVITVYFTNPKLICDANNKRRDNFVGENLYILTTDKMMTVPYKEKNIAKTKWVNGKCFKGMGQHYWYNSSPAMSCDDLFPIFLLYNQGVLNGFGFATATDISSSNVEHPPTMVLRLFFKEDEKPKCLDQLPNLSTQHVFLQRRPYLNFC